jgi:hypothetical protein
MTSYRIYSTNEVGRILTGQDTLCETDQAALAQAALTLPVGTRMEVWQGTRRLLDSTLSGEAA